MNNKDNNISEQNMDDIIRHSSSQTQQQNHTTKHTEQPTTQSKTTQSKTTQQQQHQTQPTQNLDQVIVPPTKELEIKEEKTKKSSIKTKPKKSIPIAMVFITLIGLALRQIVKHKNNNAELLANTNTGSNITNINTGNTNEQNTWDTIIETGTTDTNTGNTQNTNNELRTNLDDNYRINTKEQNIYYLDTLIPNIDIKTFRTLGHHYAKDKNSVYYKWQKVDNVQPNKFLVIASYDDYKLSGIIATSSNLLTHLQNKKNREFLMTTIASVTNKNINVKKELTTASAYAMNSFKTEYKALNKLQRWEDLSDLQRAKFGVIFLYIKLIKSLESDKIRMSVAKKELKYFINHSDEILKAYGQEKDKPTNIKWDLGYDEYCVYQNGNLFGCFLNKIFITKK